jgi:hypothetical protein
VEEEPVGELEGD